ncbi:MAG: hypothetical protein O9257_11345 [Brevundimonas sp.]|jgi:hypothetical protein|nr:hypothetical protein [Brevundimonas sp.]
MKGIILIAALGLTAGAAAAQDRGGPLARADADNDGVITRAEFIEARLAPLRRLDADGDGTVTRAEGEAVGAAMAARGGARPGPRSEQGARPRGERRGMRGLDQLPITLAQAEARAAEDFARFDLDGDGRLTAAEREELESRMSAARAGGFGGPDGDR